MPSRVSIVQLDEDFVAASCSGIEAVERRIDMRIGYERLRRKIKEFPEPYQKLFVMMFEREKEIPGERRLARMLKTSERQIRKIKTFFFTHFS